jgi:hypothetical protein
LPDYHSLTGMATNRLWAEVLRRERQLQATLLQQDAMITYSMAGVPADVEFQKRYDFLKVSLRKSLAEIDQSAYGTSYHRRTLEMRLRESQEKRKLFERLDKMESESFDLNSWLRGED